ncbi:acyltransferase family protein [Vibrio sp. SS-MA-C1-2]|uniref:acyltransferase n=1 Tax=Vibrio sp. SS-MA-C1-2 TaxID=2908646 RepID=UPI001F1D8416|nr:acyltransferase family protein [Vibrio sp. SS-MA-C1-2]UJF18053.1 acyltransferase family protein [Vibrio sp. SS-MA-C1-2]
MNSKKISSLELGRLIAMLAIIAIHSQLFMKAPLINDQPIIGELINQGARFAVPLFFLISGYLIAPKLLNSPFSTFKQYSIPLFKIWIVWSLISLATPFNMGKVMEHGYIAERTGYFNYLMMKPLNSVMEGGLVHLWFLPALIIAVGIIAVLVHFKQLKLLLPLSILLYLYGVLAGSYQPLTELSSPFFTRNGPFFSTLMVTLGFIIRKHNIKISFSKGLVIMLVGMGLHFYEALSLVQDNIAFVIHDFLFGTLLWGLGLFIMLLAKPNWGNRTWVYQLSANILGVYVIHLIIIILMKNVVGILQFSPIIADITVFTFTIILSWFIVNLINNSQLRRWLLR